MRKEAPLRIGALKLLLLNMNLLVLMSKKGLLNWMGRSIDLSLKKSMVI
jgi:hypothetical protein